MKKVKKLVSMLLVFAMTFSVAISGKITGITQVSAREALGSNDFLKVNGTQIRKQKGTGDIVYLRGTNAGGWLVQEDWMNPTNASDQKTMMTTSVSIHISQHGIVSRFLVRLIVRLAVII